MLLQLGLIVAGGVLLYFGAEWLVRGSSGLALALGIRPLVIGLTVVAFGTSAPELVVTMLAAIEGKGAIALGNVIGSNIANLGLILGVTALISPPKVNPKLIDREVPVLVISAIVVPIALYDGSVSRVDGLLLLAAAFGFTAWMLKTSKALPSDAPAVSAGAGKGSRPKLALLSLIGLALLVIGGKLFVDGASGLALALGMSERLVGLTIVSIGTSLPEMATSVVAALRRQADIAVGNVVGSNIYNVLLILGGSALVSPIDGELAAMKVDLGALVALTLMGAIFLRGDRHVSRPEAMALLVGYAAFLFLLVVPP